MSTLLSSLKSAVAHEGNKRKFFTVLGNPSSSPRERAEAYNSLMGIANHQDWNWLMSQFENNPGELNSSVMDNFFVGAAKHNRQRLTEFVTADDGLVMISVKAINSFTDFAGAAIFMTHRAVSALEVIGATEELKEFAKFIVMVCDSKTTTGLVPRKLLEERLRQYLPTDVVDDQENGYADLVSRHKPALNGNTHERKGLEGPRPQQRPDHKQLHRHTDPKDVPIDDEGRRKAASAAGTSEARANNAFATALTVALVN